MKTDTLTVDFNMPHKALQVIPRGTQHLVCREGSVWITLDHEQRDVVLRPGDVFTTRPGQRAIAYALESSVLRLAPVACARRTPTPRWRGWLRHLLGNGPYAGGRVPSRLRPWSWA